MHIIHGNAAAEAVPAGGLFDPDEADLVDGGPLEEPEVLELDITVDGQQRLMPLAVLWTDEQGAASSAVPHRAFDHGPEF